MSTEKKFEDWWKENAPKPPPDPVTLTAVERVLFLSVVEQIPKAPFAFANAAGYVVDVKGSPPVIINADGSLIVSTKLILPGTISLDLAGLGKNNVALLYGTFSSKAQSLVLDVTMASQNSQPAAKFSVTTQAASPTFTTTTMDSTKQPSPPAGLNYFNLIDPDKLDSDAKHYPVLRFGTYVYWALSYNDNRYAMAILAYDQNKKLVRTWTKTGARYIWKITVENNLKKVIFSGQSRQSVEFSFDELLSIPVVTTADSTKQPPPPQGLKYTTLQDGMSKKYPVVDFLSGQRFWALSFIDNRVAFAILKYDRVNKLVGRVDKPGARYIARITVQDDKVKFIGQSDDFVTCTTDELYNMTLVDPTVPLVTTGDANAQPKAPDGLKYTTLDGDDSKYPVLRYSGLTYWALSYIDNRVSMCILGYDGGMNIVKNLPKDGARYISRIVIDGSTVKFIGQADQSVSFTLKELAP